MKALSIKQPWASLIAHGIKDIENRTWKTNFRGRIYIHATGVSAGHFTHVLSESQLDVIYKKTDFRFLDTTLIKSAIIGEVDIIDCFINHPCIWAEKSEYEQVGPYLTYKNDKPTYNWVLANAVLYEKPILNVKGKLSFWEFDKKQSVCNYCLEWVDELPDNFGCKDCIEKHK